MRSIILLLTVCLTLPVFSQDGNNAKKGFEHEVSLQFLRSLGEFGETHPYGARLAYRHSKHRFGLLDTLPGKRIGFVYGGGLSWLNGRVEERQNLPSYRYDDFICLFFFGGVQYRICRNGELSLRAGPALSRYSETTRYNWYSGANGGFQLNSRWGIQAGFDFLKENRSAWLAMAQLGMAYSF
jgi:hypothetical protein